ncbi:tetratricopeptide repeat protein [Stackebrandtia albiflava]|nr:hypothetical protein [Stackebrandtia albiflava]
MAEHAVRLGPQKSTNHLIHGVVALEQGDAAIAVTAFQEALRWNPQSAELHRNLALARLRLGAARQTVAAVTGFADAVRADPGFRLAVPNLADAVYRLVTKGWLLALGTLVCGMVTGTLVDRFVLTGSDPAYTAGHWAAIAVAVAVTAVPGVAVAVTLLRRIPGTLRPGIARIGLRPWRTRVRSAGLAVAVAGGVVTPAVTFFPVAPFAGLAMGVLFLVARRPRSGGLG